MLGSEVTRAAYEEGYKAAKNGQNEWDNPYQFHGHEALMAYGWEAGYKDGKKEAA